MTSRDEQAIPQDELVRMALKLREDLFDLAETCVSGRELAEVMNSAGALILAITDPSGLHPSSSQGEGPSRLYSFPRRFKPGSLH